MSECSWCGNKTISNEMTYCISDDDDKHKLCPSCHLTGHACQSSCPLCWYYLAEQLINKSKFCSSCIEPLNESNKKQDDRGHSLCESCEQCILCSFRKETRKEFFSLSYREHEARIQKILYYMQICVQRSEKDREPCSICMEPLNGNLNNPVKILNICRHRFHSNCIEKWFKQKPCCPCCRHVYQVHDEPCEISVLLFLFLFLFI
jgi:hypothetical protein